MTESDQKNESSRTFAQMTLGIAGSIQDRRNGGTMSRDDRAELRRLTRSDFFLPEPFWSLVDRYDIPATEEPFWADVIPLMINHPHNNAVRPGRALAQAAVSAARIERWLRYDPQRARQEAARLFARVDGGFDWVRFAGLLRFWSDQDMREFARDYFLSPNYWGRKQKLSKQEVY